MKRKAQSGAPLRTHGSKTFRKKGGGTQGKSARHRTGKWLKEKRPLILSVHSSATPPCRTRRPRPPSNAARATARSAVASGVGAAAARTAATFVDHGTLTPARPPGPAVHRPASVSHTGRSDGQQCSLSSQQVASGRGQQAHVKQTPKKSRAQQHVAPAGQVVASSHAGPGGAGGGEGPGGVGPGGDGPGCGGVGPGGDGDGGDGPGGGLGECLIGYDACIAMPHWPEDELSRLRASLM